MNETYAAGVIDYQYLEKPENFGWCWGFPGLTRTEVEEHEGEEITPEHGDIWPLVAHGCERFWYLTNFGDQMNVEDWMIGWNPQTHVVYSLFGDELEIVGEAFTQKQAAVIIAALVAENTIDDEDEEIEADPDNDPELKRIFVTFR